MKGTGRRALRAEIVHLVDDPVVAGDRAHEHWSDGLLVLADGKVESCGDAPTLLATLPPNTEIIDYSGKLIVPGFIDAHVHYPQTDIVAAYGEKLLEWLTRYTFPTERRFDDPAYAREVADFFLAELLRNGTTTAAVFATVHPESVDAFFASAQALGARMIAGKVMMDRNCPPDLCDTAETSYEDSKALIERWHRCDRLLYAVTPRFAPTSTERQLELAGRLLDEHEGLYLQSHVAENADEVKWVAELYPWSRSYLDVYDRFGVVRERALYAHCLHLDATDRDRMGATGAAMVFCPTSNLFLGSGLFNVDAARRHRVPVAVGTDVGAGTTASRATMWKVRSRCCSSVATGMALSAPSAPTTTTSSVGACGSCAWPSPRRRSCSGSSSTASPSISRRATCSASPTRSVRRCAASQRWCLRRRSMSGCSRC